ncbi:divalent-cation tolerance protein CutA [Dissulfurirhabdus thermomarina]|uniref:Divalent-cation tolerance protein CutA n=1 Tax=Dissulfurirhabdus thermomarina TaxID=1765737 RepID=A0A6N9TS96_DISTH|nr:divalent-cation tolerance protein CutA [Dissulfurirhabdus thermomarina]NDY42973.1 divalent-cation tolerance protein CutA [Dissulfurirhabdus thermomarina]NMX23948.1 divalent-cation tolerance protein CutA [Dissulfurirhabdus thermomarina]
MSNDTAYLVVTTTAADRADADRLARSLVDRRLAACVQVTGPVTSRYRWQGRVETAEEWLITAKTRADRYPALEAELSRAHPYEVPEILAVPVSAGLPAYLAWIDESLAEPPGG